MLRLKVTKKQIAITIVFLIIISLIAYGYFELIKQNKILGLKISDLESQLNSSSENLAALQKEKNNLLATIREEAEKNDAFAKQLSQATDNLNKLEWLRKQDPQVLQKYSKVYFLNENYVPNDLARIDTKFLSTKSKSLDILYRVLPFLQKMMAAAESDNVKIEVVSAYRSFDTQASLKSNYKVTYGSGANTFSADQGYSEHQLGTAVDLSTPTIGGALTGFQKTDSYKWLVNNAYRYGFVLSYPENNSYYVFEPWHWRFVGVELATRLQNENKHFYDLDQRDIDSYLANMFSEN